MSRNKKSEQKKFTISSNTIIFFIMATISVLLIITIGWVAYDRRDKRGGDTEFSNLEKNYDVFLESKTALNLVGIYTEENQPQLDTPRTSSIPEPAIFIPEERIINLENAKKTLESKYEDLETGSESKNKKFKSNVEDYIDLAINIVELNIQSATPALCSSDLNSNFQKVDSLYWLEVPRLEYESPDRENIYNFVIERIKKGSDSITNFEECLSDNGLNMEGNENYKADKEKLTQRLDEIKKLAQDLYSLTPSPDPCPDLRLNIGSEVKDASEELIDCNLLSVSYDTSSTPIPYNSLSSYSYTPSEISNSNIDSTYVELVDKSKEIEEDYKKYKEDLN